MGAIVQVFLSCCAKKTGGNRCDRCCGLHCRALSKNEVSAEDGVSKPEICVEDSVGGPKYNEFSGGQGHKLMQKIGGGDVSCGYPFLGGLPLVCWVAVIGGRKGKV